MTADCRDNQFMSLRHINNRTCHMNQVTNNKVTKNITVATSGPEYII